MKKQMNWLIAACGVLALAFSLTPRAQADCGGFGAPAVKKSAWIVGSGRPLLQRAAYDSETGDPFSIVGFWQFKFISDGTAWGFPPNVPTAKGDTLDAGYTQWHIDGTEITNSAGRAPNTGSFCLGVWQKVGPRQYRLNHFGVAWDPSQGPDDPAGNPSGVLIGPSNIKELVTVSPNGQSYSGSFEIEGYDNANNHIYHASGTVTATRINVNTPPSPLF